MRAAVVLWWVECTLALACTLLLPFYMFTHHRWVVGRARECPSPLQRQPGWPLVGGSWQCRLASGQPASASPASDLGTAPLPQFPPHTNP